MSTIYKCPCSRCYKTSKSFTERTIKKHLQQDRALYNKYSISNPELAEFLKSRIKETGKVLSCEDPVSDSGGSHQVGSEGVLFRHFIVIDIRLSNNHNF